jgi:hypothetical protein
MQVRGIFAGKNEWTRAARTPGHPIKNQDYDSSKPITYASPIGEKSSLFTVRPQLGVTRSGTFECHRSTA